MIKSIQEKGKFTYYVDASVGGDERRGGIEGVLKVEEGGTHDYFVKYIGCSDLALAELLAIKEAIDKCMNSNCMNGRTVRITTDYEVVLKWIKRSLSEPIGLEKEVEEVIRRLEENRWEVIKVSRDENKEADALASKASENVQESVGRGVEDNGEGRDQNREGKAGVNKGVAEQRIRNLRHVTKQERVWLCKTEGGE